MLNLTASKVTYEKKVDNTPKPPQHDPEKDKLRDRVIHNHTYHSPPSEAEALKHQIVRDVTAKCALDLISLCPVSRELSIALTKMEEAMTWANAALARNRDK